MLLKTSNPGSADLQNLAVAGRPLFLTLADKLHEIGTGLTGPATGFSNLGVVFGATHPEDAAAARAALPDAVFDTRGAQGGGADAAVLTFVNCGHGPEGGVVSSPGGLLVPDGADPGAAADWEAAIDGALTHAIDDLGGAMARHG